jgi:polyhydroxybutyrate depolymerase
MRIWCVAVVASLAIHGLALAAPAAAPPRPSSGCGRDTIEHGRRIAGSIDVDGRRRDYLLDVPDTVQPHRPAPVLLDFHGFGHSAAGMWNASGFRELASRDGFVTVYPDGLPVRLRLRGEEMENVGWEIASIDGNRDVAFVRALLDDLERRYCVDTARIFSTGFSNGAFFSALLACALADRIAAVAPVSGGPLPAACAPSRPVPILIQHGRADTLIPVDMARRARDDWLKTDGCDAAATDADGPACERWTECRGASVVEYCEADVAHSWPPQGTARIWQFLQQHPLPAR